MNERHGYLKHDAATQHGHHHTHNNIDFDDIENLSSDELNKRKSNVRFLNKDSVSNNEIAHLQSLIECSIDKTVTLKDDDDDGSENEPHEELVRLFQDFYNVLLLRRKCHNNMDIPFIKHAMKKHRRDKERLYESSVFNNVTQLLMAPIAVKLNNKSYTIQITPAQSSKRELDSVKVALSSSKPLPNINSTKTSRKAQLQDHIVQSYFDHEHLTLLEIAYIVQKETNSILKKCIVSLESELVVFVFEWDIEPHFVFLLCFRLSSKVFIQSYGVSKDRILLNKKDTSTQMLHLYKQDIIGNDENEENEKIFFTHRRSSSSSSSNPYDSREYKVLFNGTKIHIDLLDKLTESNVSFVHYGYAPQTVKYLL